MSNPCHVPIPCFLAPYTRNWGRLAWGCEESLYAPPKLNKLSQVDIQICGSEAQFSLGHELGPTWLVCPGWPMHLGSYTSWSLLVLVFFSPGYLSFSIKKFLGKKKRTASMVWFTFSWTVWAELVPSWANLDQIWVIKWNKMNWPWYTSMGCWLTRTNPLAITSELLYVSISNALILEPHNKQN